MGIIMKRKITDSIVYVGADDLTIDLFESQYQVPNGISYNSYIILDDKITIMDTIDKRCTEEWLTNIEETLGNQEPSYLVVSHMEPDHAANIKTLSEKYPTMQVVGNAKTFDMINAFFDIDLTERMVTVKEGDILSLGSHTLQFYMAPMVHWPEVMVTYEVSEKVLFSADGFGKFGALSVEEPWAEEAKRYYYNIVGKYGVQVQMLLKKAAGLDISRICPLHGPVLTENLGYYIDKYNTWSSYIPEDQGVLIAYASIYGNTAAAAEKMAEIIRAQGVRNVLVRDLAREDMAQVVSDAFTYDKLIIASPTYDGGVFPCVDTFLRKLQMKNYQKRKVGFMENGSWAPMAAKKMREAMEGLKEVTICEQVVSIKSAMKAANIDEMKKLTEELCM